MSGIALKTPMVDLEKLWERANSRGKKVQVDRDALLRLLMDHDSMLTWLQDHLITVKE